MITVGKMVDKSADTTAAARDESLVQYLDEMMVDA